MSVKLRLRREGTTKKPHFRVVAADTRSPRDGRFIEIIGHYHPMQEPSGIEIDGERALYWLRNGAQPSNQVKQLLRITGVWEEFKPGDEPKRQRTEKAKVSKKAKERAEEEPKAEAAKAEEAPAEEPKAEEAPVEEPKAEEAPAEEPKAEEAPAEEPKAEEAPAEEPKTEGAPEAEAAADESAADAETTEESSE